MRLITFGQGRVGATDGTAVWDLTARLGVLSVKRLLGELAAAERACKGPGDRRMDEIALGLPLPDPAKIVCVGVNYMDRNAEYRDGSGGAREAVAVHAHAVEPFAAWRADLAAAGIRAARLRGRNRTGHRPGPGDGSRLRRRMARSPG